ncbi:hypothetical protein ACODM8_14360 [Vibrio ostreicida]|uniref:hypothetical protein n=1 Tax=Vibrio ostreicida TaxID=526588 RepID=UPI003B59C202
MYKNDFINSIHNKQKVQLVFSSKEDGCDLTRLCAPMDFGPSQRKNIKDQSDRFHLWNYESDTKNHSLSILPEQVVRMTFLQDSFCPSEFVTWSPNWLVERDWGEFS